MFNESGYDRLVAWKQFRDSLENSSRAFEDVAELWANAPFVEPYLNPFNHTEWPDPWKLVLDSRLDDLAITLGMLYTLKLTQRFKESKFDIHTFTFPNEKQPRYFLIVDEKKVLNLEYRAVIDVENLGSINSIILWSSDNE